MPPIRCRSRCGSRSCARRRRSIRRAASSPRRSAARRSRRWRCAAAGFDFLFNSAKWWDFRAPWLLEQYDLYRQVAPTVAFPESHDTERLAMELGDPEPPELERHYRLRYLFAAAFSSGVMMPMGYEYGCRTPLDVVGSRPGDWAWETAEPRHRSHGLRRRGQPHEGGDAGAQRRRAAEEGDRAAQSGGRAAAPVGRRRGLVGGRRDRADQPRSARACTGSIPGR